MKKIIGGKLFDTETAQEIGAHETRMIGRRDFNYYFETLYRTPRGNFFLVGEGGPLTRWATRAGNGYNGGSGLQEISAGEALTWCAHAELDVVHVAAIFGDEIQAA